MSDWRPDGIELIGRPGTPTQVLQQQQKQQRVAVCECCVCVRFWSKEHSRHSQPGCVCGCAQVVAGLESSHLNAVFLPIRTERNKADTARPAAPHTQERERERGQVVVENRHSNRHAPGYPEAQGAFKVSMTHWILQFALRIAFRCVLHRCGSQDIRC